MGAAVEVRLPVHLTDESVRRQCTGLHEQLRSGAVSAVVCRVDRAAGDLATVDAVARLALVARRAGVTFALDGCGAELTGLLGLVGLGTALAELADDA